MAEGNTDEYLRLHPLRPWQDRSATIQLGKLHDRFRRECPSCLQPPFVQRQCRAHLRLQLTDLNYHGLIAERMTTVLRRMQIEDHGIVNMMAAHLLDAILMASAILTCTDLQAMLRFVQNGFTIGAVGCKFSMPVVRCSRGCTS